LRLTIVLPGCFATPRCRKAGTVGTAMLHGQENGNSNAVICRNLTPASPIFSRKFAGYVKFQWKAVIA